MQLPHLLGIEGLDAEQITTVLDTAEEMAQVQTRELKKLPALRGRTIVKL